MMSLLNESLNHPWIALLVYIGTPSLLRALFRWYTDAAKPKRAKRAKRS